MAEQNQARPPETPPGGRPFRFMVDYQVGDALPMFSKPHFQWLLHTDYMGRRFVYRPVSESTMDDARRILERMRLPEGAVMLAETQTAGRGRAGRAWVSPPDVNLYFTFLLFPEPAGLRPLAYVTPLAVALAVEEVTEAAGKKITPELKWPNDVLVSGLKLAGILIEIDHMPDRIGAIVGVGINVNVEPDQYEEISGIATSMKVLAGHEFPREEVLAAFCNQFERLYEEALSGSRRPFEQWRGRLITLGKAVTAERNGLPLFGKAVDVEDDGALVIEREDGLRERVEAGDVFLVRT